MTVSVVSSRARLVVFGSLLVWKAAAMYTPLCAGKGMESRTKAQGWERAFEAQGEAVDFWHMPMSVRNVQ